MKFFLILICFITFSLSAFAQTKDSVKFVVFGNHSCEDYLARMDALLTELGNAPNSKAYIMVYEGRSPIFGYHSNGKYVVKKYILSRVGEAKSRIRTMIRRLAFRGFPSERIVFINAGFREDYTVEFWIIPSGAETPKPTPTLKKMKYRKGKPQDFCGNDEI